MITETDNQAYVQAQTGLVNELVMPCVYFKEKQWRLDNNKGRINYLTIGMNGYDEILHLEKFPVRRNLG